ncbi:MAG: biotin--[Clostridia bacterium]|nr:biotin--[acetyl-CoA-carboxylase] ligase [Clostridia bacterium]
MDILTTIKQHLNTDFFDLTVVDEIDSTNRVVKQWGKEGKPQGSVLIARSQTAGRGRLGRSFYSPKSGIYFSILLRPHLSLKDTMRLTTAAAVSVADALGEQAKIKWVNDIYLHGKKVCGILTESAFSGEKTDYAVVGIGLNLTAPDEGFPTELNEIAGAIFDNTPTEEQVAHLIVEILSRFEKAYHNLFDATLFETYEKRNLLQGKTVTVGTLSGVVVGINEDFALLIKGEAGQIHTIQAGEATIGSAAF